MPNNKNPPKQKRGLKGATRRATKMVRKAFEAQAKRKNRAELGYRHPYKPNAPKPSGPPRATKSLYDQIPDRSGQLTREDVLDVAKGSGIISPALGGGLTAAALNGPRISTTRSSSTSSPKGPIYDWMEKANAYAELDAKIRRAGGIIRAHQRTPISDSKGVDVYSAPVRYGTRNHGHAPKLWAKARNGDVEVIVEHTEYVSDLVSPGSAFWPNCNNMVQYPVNPGQSPLFPWLSILARNFDEYKFDKLEFGFDPMVGTGANGKMVATFDPDVLDEFPDSKADALQARVQLDDSIWMTNDLKVPKDLLTDYLFVRPGAMPVGADQHVYDVGVLNLGLPGVAAGTSAEFFVTYKVRLRTPNGGQRSMMSNVTFNNPTIAAPGGTSITNVGTVPVTWKSGNTFTIDAPGSYWFCYSHVGTGVVGVNALTATAPNVRTVGDSLFNGANTQAVYSARLDVTDVTAPFTFPGLAGTTVSLSRCKIVNYDADQYPNI